MEKCEICDSLIKGPGFSCPVCPRCPNEHHPTICFECYMGNAFPSKSSCYDCHRFYSACPLSCGVLHIRTIIGSDSSYFHDASCSSCPLCYRVVFCKCHVSMGNLRCKYCYIELQKHQCKDCLKDRYFQLDVIDHTCANHGHDDGGKTTKIAKCEDQ